MLSGGWSRPLPTSVGRTLCIYNNFGTCIFFSASFDETVVCWDVTVSSTRGVEKSSFQQVKQLEFSSTVLSMKVWGRMVCVYMYNVCVGILPEQNLNWVLSHIKSVLVIFVSF